MGPVDKGEIHKYGELTYKTYDEAQASTVNKDTRKSHHKASQITRWQLDTLRLKHKNTLKNIMNKPKIQPNLSAARKHKEARKKSLEIPEICSENKMETDVKIRDVTALEKENNIFRAQIAQLQAIIERNKTNSHTEASEKANIPTNKFEMLLEIEDTETEERSNDSIIDSLKKKNAKKRIIEEAAPSTSNFKLHKGNTSNSATKMDINTNNKNSIPLEKRKKNHKPPPIHIETQDPKDTAELLVKELGMSQFYIKRINANVLQIDTEENFTNTKDLLKKTGTRFYSYTPKENKMPTYVLKGLHNSYTETEILKELHTLQLTDITFCKVSRLTTKRASENNLLLPIYLVQLSPDSNLGKLKDIKYLNYQVIRWERLKKKESVQCKRCQSMGHAASNCSMNYRCVKCKEEHGPGECLVPKNMIEKEKLFCVNCNKFGHPASYRGCPVIIANRNKIIEKGNLNAINRQKRINKIEAYIKPDVSFAEATNKLQYKPHAETQHVQINNETILPAFNTVKEIQEIKFNLAKYIQDQQIYWRNLEKMINNNAYKIEMLTNTLTKRNG